jgi:hypothetical protein
LICEHKSKGEDLDKAQAQSSEYLVNLSEEEYPRYSIVSDFENLILQDKETGQILKIKTEDLPKHLDDFKFMGGQVNTIHEDQELVNIQAAELMGTIHDDLYAVGYTGHDLEIFLVRLLFILFAEDTGIFEKSIFTDYLINRTRKDGSDLGSQIKYIFEILNKPQEKRLTNLDEDLARFSYINGGLFAESIETPQFDSSMRQTLIKACKFDWSGISPAIFGSLFQYVMDKDKRRSFGAHYTEEKIILRTIKPLFLDDLWKEFEAIKKLRSQAQKAQEFGKFHTKIASTKFFDPACGCGNFLVITYKEIRKLELEILKMEMQGQQLFEISELVKVDVDQFYGIEVEEFPAKIAETALWLMDHIANTEVSKTLGEYYARIPLKKQATIVHGNALRINWEDVLAGSYSPKSNLEGLENLVTENFVAETSSLHGKQELSSTWQNQQIYIIGNPPFVGSKLQSTEQRNEMKEIFKGVNGAGVMDYVTAWYIKAGELTKINPKIEVAFVSTNSISQGEQVGILWGEMFKQFGVEIKFAHKSFSWTSEARGKAQVTVIIIGFAKAETLNQKILFEYPDIKGEPVVKTVKNINPYLVGGDNVVITKRSKPICDVPEMTAGNVAYDYGYLIFTEEEMKDFVSKEPLSEKWFKKLIGGQELINGDIRYCLWLVDILPTNLRKMPLVLERVQKVKEGRLNAKDKGTHKLADRAFQFRDLNNPDQFIAIPKTSSENRKYIPMVLLDKEFIPSDSIRFISTHSLYHFGILTSQMHMAWVKYTCGKLESRFRYSKDIVYNNFPWPGVDGEISAKPELKNDKLKTKIEECAKEVLEVRAKFKDASLADLYDPLSMPPELTKAHQKLDKAVDEAYCKDVFKDDTERVEHLFEMYKELTK